MAIDPLSLHDVLVAWHDGAITTAKALRLARVKGEDELISDRAAPRVLPMPPLTHEERAHQARVDAILGDLFGLDDLPHDQFVPAKGRLPKGPPRARAADRGP